jgi:hypothetical protein
MERQIIDAGKNGIKQQGAWNATCRNYKIFHQKQSDPDFQKLIITKLLLYSSPGNKLSDRFNTGVISCLQNQWTATI